MSLPHTDSIAELARFWDEHDVMDFESELEVVRVPVFQRSVVQVPLQPDEAEALHRAAQARGLDDPELVHEWVAEKLRAS